MTPPIPNGRCHCCFTLLPYAMQDQGIYCSRACEHIMTGCGWNGGVCVVCGNPCPPGRAVTCSDAHQGEMVRIRARRKGRLLRRDPEASPARKPRKRATAPALPTSTCIVCDKACDTKYCSDECRKYGQGLEYKANCRAQHRKVSSTDLFEAFRPTEDQWLQMYDNCVRLGILTDEYEVDRVNWMILHTDGPEEPFALHNLGIVRHPKSAFDTEEQHQPKDEES